jgi:hypothetical protein
MNGNVRRMQHKKMSFDLLLFACSLLFVAVAAAFEQDQPKRIGEIEFYGYGGMELESIRRALPLREGDELASTPEAIEAAMSRLKEIIEQATGHPPTDIQAVCCDERGDGMIYIGLQGKTSSSSAYNPAPKGRVRLPAKIVDLYEESLNDLVEAVTKGAGEEHSSGYALSTDSTLRAKQLAMRAYAQKHERQLRRVLRLSSDELQRSAAAQILGYTRQSNEQLAALVQASRDADEIVRNNAIRALIVLASANPKVGARIPASKFIEMLSSGFWTDRNKASLLLGILTEGRDPKLLGQLRAQALAPLIEMARWRNPSHAYAARILLGRVAGIEEKRLQQLLHDNQVETIIKALSDVPGRL